MLMKAHLDRQQHQIQQHMAGDLHNHGGFTLIEVLVSMLILAVGLLGIAALQFKGLQYSTDASIRSNITLFASDIANRMHLNSDNANSYLVAGYAVPVARPTACVQGTGANSTNDLNCWYQSFWIDQDSSHIPPGTSVSIAAAVNPVGSTAPANSFYNVQFQWRDRENTLHNIDYIFAP